MVRIQLLDCGRLTINGVPVTPGGVSKTYVDAGDYSSKLYTDDARAYLEALIASIPSGIYWQPAVIDLVDELPVNPGREGARYISTIDNKIYESIVASDVENTIIYGWRPTDPVLGMTVFLQTIMVYYMFTDTHWQPFAMVVDHDNLLNRGQNTHAQIDAKMEFIDQDVTEGASPSFTTIRLDPEGSAVLGSQGFMSDSMNYTTDGIIALGGQDLNITNSPSGTIKIRNSDGAVGINFKDSYTTFNGAATITSPSNSTTAQTGALTVTGGLGVGKDITIGGSVKVSSFIQGRNIQAIESMSASTIAATSTAENAFVCSGTIQAVGLINSLNDTDSSAVSSGAIVTPGGLGVGKKATIGGRLTVQDTTLATSSSTGALVVSGGIGTANIVTDGTVKVGSTTESTSLTSGALTVSGGAGVAKNLVAGALYSQSVISISNTNNGPYNRLLNLQCPGLTGTNETFMQIQGGYYGYRLGGNCATITTIGTVPAFCVYPTAAAVEFATQSTAVGNGSFLVAGGTSIAKNLNVGGTVNVNDTTASTSSTTGSVIIKGGVGVAKHLFAAGQINTNTSFNVISTATAAYNELGNFTTSGVTANSGKEAYILVNGSYLGYRSTASPCATLALNGVPSALAVYSNRVETEFTTPSTSTSTGSLVVKGGIGIQGNVWIPSGTYTSSFSGAASGPGPVIIATRINNVTTITIKSINITVTAASLLLISPLSIITTHCPLSSQNIPIIVSSGVQTLCNLGFNPDGTLYINKGMDQMWSIGDPILYGGGTFQYESPPL